MKNIHVIPTENSSRLHKVLQSTFILKEESAFAGKLFKSTPQYIYITSSEQIKDGDYFYLYDANIITKYVSVKPVKEGKKIILTTDLDLIADGVQAIDDEFLEWFVKNPKCEEVGVVMKWEGNSAMFGWKMGNVSSDGEFIYKIIIPTEEPKPHSFSFCETPDKKCTMNYCDENGCMNRKRELVEPKQETIESQPKVGDVMLSLPLFRQLFDELLNAGRDMRDRDRLGLYYLPEDEYFENVVKRYSNNGNGA